MKANKSRMTRTANNNLSAEVLKRRKEDFARNQLNLQGRLFEDAVNFNVKNYKTVNRRKNENSATKNGSKG